MVSAGRHFTTELERAPTLRQLALTANLHWRRGLRCWGLQVFYHLGELNDSLTYALGAGELFDVTDNSEFVQTLVGE